MSGRGNVQSGKYWSGNCPVGYVTVGEVSVGEISSRGSVRTPLKASLDWSSARFINAFFKENKIPLDWNDSYPISLFKIKRSTNQRGNNKGLKLTEHVLKVTERVLEKYIRNIIKTDEVQFGFMPGVGTNDASFITWQIQVKNFATHKNPHIDFVDLEKTFDCIPRKVTW